MNKGMVRHMYPGGNTSSGFYSFYDYILPQDEAEKIFIIKGGPGVGKSTFMKKIAEEMVDEGFDAEIMHCSSDVNSIDGVLFPQIKAALIDGTAPHTVDPKNPGAVDEIINFGDLWDEEGIKKNRRKIAELNKKVGKLFSRAYSYLKAAACVYRDSESIYDEALDSSKVNDLVLKTVDKLFVTGSASVTPGKERHMFASAITPGGLENYLESVVGLDKVYILKTVPGLSTEIMLKRIKERAVEKGYYVECYHCAMFPERLEHIVIPEIKASFTTSSKYHSARVKPAESIDFTDFLDEKVLMEHREALEYNSNVYDSLLNKAIESINQAKETHDVVEKYYKNNMDFEAVESCREFVMHRILELASCFSSKSSCNPGNH